jgi:bifunctional DNA-binding transcriptional regulator/antitoxin component of YhaV-PrlF toxin-antitoxin module
MKKEAKELLIFNSDLKEESKARVMKREKNFNIILILFIFILLINISFISASLQKYTLKVTEEHPFFVVGYGTDIINVKDDIDEGGGESKVEIGTESEIKDKNNINGIWKTAKELKIGDELLTEDGKKAKVTYLKSVDEDVDVYNLNVNNVNNYYAENVLVHNKLMPYGPGVPELGWAKIISSTKWYLRIQADGGYNLLIPEKVRIAIEEKLGIKPGDEIMIIIPEEKGKDIIISKKMSRKEFEKFAKENNLNEDYSYYDIISAALKYGEYQPGIYEAKAYYIEISKENAEYLGLVFSWNKNSNFNFYEKGGKITMQREDWAKADEDTAVSAAGRINAMPILVKISKQKLSEDWPVFVEFAKANNMPVSKFEWPGVAGTMEPQVIVFHLSGGALSTYDISLNSFVEYLRTQEGTAFGWFLIAEILAMEAKNPSVKPKLRNNFRWLDNTDLLIEHGDPLILLKQIELIKDEGLKEKLMK